MTLIELLVSVAITVILMVAVTSMFITSINTTTRTHARQVIKAEGSYAINQISFFLRNSIALNVCTNLSDNIVITNVDGGKTTFSLIPPAIASNGATMTSPSVTASGLVFVCNNDVTTGERYITVDFSLASTSVVGIGESFSSVILLRN